MKWSKIVLGFALFFGLTLRNVKSENIRELCGRPVKDPGGNAPRIQVTKDPNDNPPGTWPWMGTLGYYSGTGKWVHECGASLISKAYALTAAHCKPLNLWKIRFGESNIDSEADDSESFESAIEDFIVHPRYQEHAYFDVALIKLSSPIVTFTKFILPVCLPEKPVENLSERTGVTATIAGWGFLARDAFETSDQLRSTTLTIFNQGYCDSQHLVGDNDPFRFKVQSSLPRLFRPSVLCAGDAVRVIYYSRPQL